MAASARILYSHRMDGQHGMSLANTAFGYQQSAVRTSAQTLASSVPSCGFGLCAVVEKETSVSFTNNYSSLQ